MPSPFYVLLRVPGSKTRSLAHVRTTCTPPLRPKSSTEKERKKVRMFCFRNTLSVRHEYLYVLFVTVERTQILPFNYRYK
jgi:hypothetical protein